MDVEAMLEAAGLVMFMTVLMCWVQKNFFILNTIYVVDSQNYEWTHFHVFIHSYVLNKKYEMNMSCILDSLK